MKLSLYIYFDWVSNQYFSMPAWSDNWEVTENATKSTYTERGRHCIRPWRSRRCNPCHLRWRAGDTCTDWTCTQSPAGSHTSVLCSRSNRNIDHHNSILDSCTDTSPDIQRSRSLSRSSSQGTNSYIRWLDICNSLHSGKATMHIRWCPSRTGSQCIPADMRTYNFRSGWMCNFRGWSKLRKCYMDWCLQSCTNIEYWTSNILYFVGLSST